MEKLTTEKAWDILTELNLATHDELSLVTDINGYSLSTLEDVLYARTGLRDFDDL